jgi:hypothetical protein
MSIRHGEAFLHVFSPGETPAPLIRDGLASRSADALGAFDNPVRPRTWDEAHALAPGVHFYDPAGVLRVRD